MIARQERTSKDKELREHDSMRAREWERNKTREWKRNGARDCDNKRVM